MTYFKTRQILELIHFNNDSKYLRLFTEYIVADAGYGSEQNYMAIIDDFNKTPLITYGMFIKDKTRKFKSDILTLKTGNMTNLMMNLYVLITKE